MRKMRATNRFNALFCVGIETIGQTGCLKKLNLLLTASHVEPDRNVSKLQAAGHSGRNFQSEDTGAAVPLAAKMHTHPPVVQVCVWTGARMEWTDARTLNLPLSLPP